MAADVQEFCAGGAVDKTSCFDGPHCIASAKEAEQSRCTEGRRLDTRECGSDGGSVQDTSPRLWIRDNSDKAGQAWQGDNWSSQAAVAHQDDGQTIETPAEPHLEHQDGNEWPYSLGADVDGGVDFAGLPSDDGQTIETHLRVA